MSHRVKRPNRSEDGSVSVKRRKRATAEEEEAAALAIAAASASSGGGAAMAAAAQAGVGGVWQPPRSNDLKSIYNRSTTEAPAELFRKDLISAMKLPDSEPLANDEYWIIVDQWKQEWERGVQVPVNPDSLPEPLVSIKPSSSKFKPHTEFKLPKKYIRITKDDNFKAEEHVLSHAPAKAEAACSYDLDECDVAWLRIFNAERASSGLSSFTEEQLERVIERLELCCWDKIQSILRNEEGLGIEYDENVICDVCRSPDSEEGNEMVFCDSCNICVHQACYGITRIPEGQWLCCTCNIGKRPECVLCPNKGGAMKCLRTGQKWAHVSCALWIPEVSIGCVEKMEPITKVSSIPQSRWALICVLCRERVGACIQCSVKTCKTAYHVTCAFKHGLEMRAIIEDENADDGVKLRSYCEKHSKSSKKGKSTCSGSEDDDVKRKKRKDMTSEEKNQARAIRLQEVEAEFFKHVSVKDVSIHFNADNDSLQYIYNYWKLKRKAGFNKPLLPPKSEDVDVLSHKREQADLEKMKMFVQLRQDLERVRNLCYMVSRREKLSRTFFRMREQTFHKQAAVLDSSASLPASVIEAVVEANHGPSIYDRLYSHNEAEDHTTDFETILARISGKSPTHSGDEINGLFKDVKNNPYKKKYNGCYSKRRSNSMYGSSMSDASSSSDEKPKDNKENRLHTDTEEDKPSVSTLTKKKTSLSRIKQNNVSKVVERKRRKKLDSRSSNKIDNTSSEEERKPSKKDLGTRSRLSQVEKELGDTGSESDELMPIRTSIRDEDNQKTAKSMSSIYSDTDSSDGSAKNDDKSSSATNDSQSRVRTKASFKEFSHKVSKSNKGDSEVKRKSAKVEQTKKEKESKKKDYVSSDLIVPQRQAAKKATENLKTTTTSRAKEYPPPVEEPSPKMEEKKQKTKGRPPKDKDKEVVKESPKEEVKEKEHPKEVREKKKEKEKDKEKESKQLLDVFDFDKDDKAESQELLYVPQRQAAKKAAEHIKSGLGKPAVPVMSEAPPQEILEKDKNLKKPQENMEKDKTLKKPQESLEKDKNLKKPQESLEKDKNLKKPQESLEKDKNIKKPQESLEKDKNLKKPQESLEKDKNLKKPQESLEKDKNLKKPQEVLEKDKNLKKEVDNKKTDVKRPDVKNESVKPAKVSESKRKSSTNSSSNSSSSSSSSSDSSSSSSSDSDDEPQSVEKTPQLPRSESSPREASKRSTAKEWPFLDKGARPAATSGSSSSSDSSPSSSPSKKTTSPPQSSSRDSPSRAATEHQTSSFIKHQSTTPRRSGDKKQPPSTSKREEQPRRGRGRGRPRASNSGDRIGDANVRSRDMSDGQRVSLEGERSKGRKGKSTPEDTRVQKEIPESKLLSPVRKTDKKLKEIKSTEIGTLEKEILERKADKGAKNKSSKFERLFGTPDKEKDKVVKPERPEKVRKDLSKTLDNYSKVDRPLIAPEKLTIPDKSNKVADKAKPADKEKSPQRNQSAEKVKPAESSKLSALPDLSDKITKPEKTTKDSLIKSPNKELKEQIDKKLEDKKQPIKKAPTKNKSIDDIFANKLSSETKENKEKKPPTPKQSKASDEISLADKIVDDHLQTHKAKDLFNRQSEVVQESFHVAPEVTKALLNDLDAEKKNSLKPAGLTNQVLQNRSIFSPQPHVKDSDFLDLVNFDEIGIPKDDELMKTSLSWNFNTCSNNIIREDTKEDSARETLNLVEKLRMGLSKKSGPDEPTTSSETEIQIESSEQFIESDDGVKGALQIDLELKVQVTEIVPDKAIPEINRDVPQQPDYNYMSNNLPLGQTKEIPVRQTESLTNHIVPVQGDERWVPPSNSNYPNVQALDPRNYMDSVVSQIDPQYLEQYANKITSAETLNQEHHKKQLNCLPAQLEARLQEEVLKTHTSLLQDRLDRRITQTPGIDPSSLDCMNSPMPYAGHPQAKWADSEIIPNRRSSSSSASSTSSSSRRDEDETQRMPPDVRLMNNSSLDVTSYQVPALYPPNPMDSFGGYTGADGSLYPVSLFPPPSLNTQLPFPTGYPPAFGAAFPAPTTHSMLPMPSKPVDNAMMHPVTPCTAAFTTSQHNLEFTAAVVNMPPSNVSNKPIEQQLNEQLLAPPAAEPVAPPALTPTTSSEEVIPSPAISVIPSPALSNSTPTANSTLPSPSTSLKSNSSAGKKSPSKPTRTSARVSSQMMNKSPAKSPGKSPRQETALKQSGPGRGRGESKRGSGKSGTLRGSGTIRGRGRGKGRGRGSHHNNDFDFMSTGTVFNKLVGTVYDLDFDDDISNDNMTDLKSMRERRKSLDVHERKFEPFSSIRDTSRSPKFSSPSQASHKGRSYNTDLRDLRPPTPIEDSRSKTDTSLASSENDPPRAFPDVTPPLPGPVDMRTYNSNFDQQTYNEQNLLSAFDSGTAETQVQDIDEDFEKELHSALTAKKPVEPPPPLESASTNMKVSLSDSRNQLKVKIKGPIANYTSTVVPLPALPPPALDSGSTLSTVNSVSNNVILNTAPSGGGVVSGGPSSLRRMRKKELLRQYWTQDMNMDDPASNTGFTAPTAPTINRTIITIPKAVASMTSIPTKEDYRDYRTDSDDIIDSKHQRKERSRPLSRELRQLDLTTDNDSHFERRRSLGAPNSSYDPLANKRRGRPIRPSPSIQQQPQPVTPKLKIKIGNNLNSIVAATPHVDIIDDKRDRIRPPKKRLAATQNKPSVEEMKRLSMKFRKQILKDLKIKHKKKDKSEKKDRSEKKKKRKLKSEVQIITNAGENPTKLIIRFGKKSEVDGDSDKRTSAVVNHLVESVPEPKIADLIDLKDPLKDPLADTDDECPPPIKLTPIKLKLSRCHEGSGYMMKPPIQNAAKVQQEERSVQPGQPPPAPPESVPPDDTESERPTLSPPLSTTVSPTPPVLKDCEVR